MSTENIDDLFRNQLEGHSTPPGDALWERLQASTPPPAPSAERLDELFQKTLSQHITPPRRELWERLEDEHLRPRKRGAAWWPMALAAALALLLVAGGAGLWSGYFGGGSRATSVASAPAASGRATTSPRAALRNSTGADAQVASAPAPTATEAPAAAGLHGTASFPNEKNIITQATRSQALASTTPKANRTLGTTGARLLKQANRQPDATTQQPALVAKNDRPAPLAPGADEHRTSQEAPAVATVAQAPVVASSAAPAPNANAPAPDEVISVDVRHGGPAPAVAAAAKAASVANANDASRRLRLGQRLLAQANSLVRGDGFSITQAAGLPDNVTIRAVIAGRPVTKSIEL